MGDVMLEALEPRRHFNIAPDAGFASNGRFVADLDRYDSAYGMARQSDGKIIIATDGPNDGVLRLWASGQRDNSFVYPADLAGKGILRRQGHRHASA